MLNTLLRRITLEMHPFEAQFLRYLFGVGLLFLCLWLPAFAALFRR